MFKGTYRHRLDGKGRLPIPAAFRRGLATERIKGLVATLVDQCVAIYPASEWQKLEDQLRSLPTFHRQTKALSRNLASRAVDCALDSQGRILLPPALRAAAGLRQEAVVVGVIDRIEVWSPGAWEDFLRDSERLLEDVSLEVAWPVPGRDSERGGGGPGSTGQP